MKLNNAEDETLFELFSAMNYPPTAIDAYMHWSPGTARHRIVRLWVADSDSQKKQRKQLRRIIGGQYEH